MLEPSLQLHHCQHSACHSKVFYTLFQWSMSCLRLPSFLLATLHVEKDNFKCIDIPCRKIFRGTSLFSNSRSEVSYVTLVVAYYNQVGGGNTSRLLASVSNRRSTLSMTLRCCFPVTAIFHLGGCVYLLRVPMIEEPHNFGSVIDGSFCVEHPSDAV